MKCIINFFKIKRKKNNKIKKGRVKLSLLHIIETDKSKYYIYNVQPNYAYDSICLEIWKDNKINILEKEIFEESYGLLGGDSFDSFVKTCLNELRNYIKVKNEFIINDKKILSKSKVNEI